MRLGFCASAVACFAILSAAGAPQDISHTSVSAPLRFEPVPGNGNGGFVARGLRFEFSFARNGAVLHAGKESVRLTFAGASQSARPEGLDRLRSTTNIIRGNDAARWSRGLPNYGRLQVRDLYPGVDLIYYGTGRELEYDLVVKPASDPAQVRLRFDGSRVRLDRKGNLVAGFVQKHPTAYQIAANGERVRVASRYRRNSDGTFGFALGHYDRSREVIIDPVLTLSAYVGGSGQDVATAIGHDLLGYIYVAGTTLSNDLTADGTPAIGALTGNSDIFIAKLDPHVTPDQQLVYISYFGGSGDEMLNDMTVTPSGMVYLTGSTTSTDFPLANAAQSALSGTSDAFVMGLDLNQNQVVYSTYLGGSGDDLGSSVAVDSKGRIFVAGTTRSMDLSMIGGFQTVNGSAQTAFVAALDPSQSGTATLIYSSYIGGAGGESGRGVALASDGSVWVVGGTHSGDFPVANSPYQAVYHPGGDGFIAHIDPAQTGGASLLYASYLGGSEPDEIKSVVVDAAGRVVVSGYTGSKDFPVTTDALQANFGGNFDAFVTVLDPRNRAAQLVYSTFYGGSEDDVPFDLKIDSGGNLYLTGFTTSPDLQVSGNALQPKYNPVTLDGFVLKFNPVRPSLGGIGYSSYVTSNGRQITYAVDFDTAGNIYAAGYTTGAMFDSFGGIAKTTSPGNLDAFLMGINTCSITLSSTTQNFSSQGGTAAITVIPSTPDCPWLATSPADWITVSPASGTGAGSVTITVQANTTGASRTATLVIGGVAVVVNQAA